MGLILPVNILDQVLTGPEAAAEWGLAESTVRNAAAAGRFEPYEARRAGKNWLITRDGMQRVFDHVQEEI